ncbi:MAG: hypothetical protein LBD21_10525 [Tannerellaceae bacterium]|nr:hypothetical protein [Tannerellaceae bacterium]
MQRIYALRHILSARTDGDSARHQFPGIKPAKLPASRRISAAKLPQYRLDAGI